MSPPLSESTYRFPTRARTWANSRGVACAGVFSRKKPPATIGISSSDAAATVRGRNIRATSRRRRERAAARSYEVIYRPTTLSGDGAQLPDPIQHVGRIDEPVQILDSPDEHRVATIFE